MIVKCINPGTNVNISKSTEYEVIEELDDKYAVINDKGVQKNYVKKLFKEVVAAKEVIVKKPVEPVEVVAKTYNIETEFTSGYGNDVNDKYSVKIKVNDKVIINDEDNEISSEVESAVSCGVHELSGVNDIISFVENIAENLEEQCLLKKIIFKDKVTIDIIQKELLDTIIQDILEDISDRAGILLMSTNVTGDGAEEYEDLFEIFRKKADSVTKTENPNSENTIELWVYNLLD